MVRINKKTKCVGRFNTELEALNAQKLAYKNYKQVN
jgi:hypothetical protein